MQAIENMDEIGSVGVTALVVPCSAKKSKLSSPGLMGSRLTAGRQLTVGSRWQQQLRESTPCIQAGELYSGSSFRRVRQLGLSIDRPVWVISAGLGLVSAEQLIPPYDLTLSSASAASLPNRILGDFRHDAWWELVQTSPFANTLSSIFDSQHQSRVLVALTKPYAQLIGNALATMPLELRSRLRVFGPGIVASLPQALRSQVLYYDQRLDSISPGIKLDAAARALVHFGELTAQIPITTVEDDQALIELALEPIQVQPGIQRVRWDDDTLREHLRPWASQGLPLKAALRRLRDDSRVSCEERRFRRLYDEVRV